MTAITGPCTCSVDGESGTADTRYRGYSFTGCGAHVDYSLGFASGGGYERVWCYVTSPPDCPGESPYIPEGFKTDNTLPEWEAQGAAWKECYDGYRCEAWWGSLEGSPEGEPVVLDAPLDWPDCCALCSNSDGGGGDDRDDGPTTGAACAGWSFDPSTGSCQLMSTVGSASHGGSLGVNSTIHGYPGYFEAPLDDCWGRTQFDLCRNTNVAFIVPGVFLALIGLCCCYCYVILPLWSRPRVLRKLIADPESRLVKAACVQVTGTKTIKSAGKGGVSFRYDYSGTFITRDGALLVVPPVSRRSRLSEAGRGTEKNMLRVLFSTGLNPRNSSKIDVRVCETPDGLRSEFAKMVKATGDAVRRRTETLSSPTNDRRFDCLLLLGTARGGASNREGSMPKALLVGILGEDRITCGVGDAYDDKAMKKAFKFGACCLTVAIVLLIMLCITLLTNDAAQNMAAWMFEGDFRIGAVVGLVLCVSLPALLCVWLHRRNRSNARLVEQCSLVAESAIPSRT